MSLRRSLVALLGSILFLAAAAIVAWSTVSTSTARLSATTDGSGFFAAGTVDLARPASSVALLFDADGLYPGRVVRSCVVIDYDGSIEADVRLHAAGSGGTGLEDHVELRLWLRRTGGSCPDPEETGDLRSPDGAPIFDGRLGDLWRTHPTYADGLVLEADARSGDRLVLEAEAELVGGDDAQGRTTEFTVTVEARP